MRFLQFLSHEKEEKMESYSKWVLTAADDSQISNMPQ